MRVEILNNGWVKLYNVTYTADQGRQEKDIEYVPESNIEAIIGEVEEI
jgi:hypothetical protein